MMDYTKIKWNAHTFWEFCGSHENLKLVREHYYRCHGIAVPIEELGYRFPYNGYAYRDGDIVTYKHGNGEMFYAVVVKPYSIECGFGALVIKLYNGTTLHVQDKDVPTTIAIAKVPAELIALARVEAGKAPITEKCPLKDAGVCMRT